MLGVAVVESDDGDTVTMDKFRSDSLRYDVLLPGRSGELAFHCCVRFPVLGVGVRVR